MTDPTITTNDNVWGVPWVVGAKGQIPAFNEYCYSTEVFVGRDLIFVRYPSGVPGLYVTNRPPQYTNQFFMMLIPNAFGAEVWNFYPTAFTNSVTLVLSNQVSITLTNNYNFGTNLAFNSSTNMSIDSWPSGQPYQYFNPPGFVIPLFTNTVLLPPSYWSESTKQFVAFTNGVTSFLASDLQQTGWPVHDWTLNITNNLIYALVDNGSGHVLDFVNLGAFGSSLDFNQALTNISEYPSVWIVAPATDAPHSQMSEGARNQIVMGIEQTGGQVFYDSLLGLPGGYPSSLGYFSPPTGQDIGPANAIFIQSCSWQAGNPLVHYTLEDLTNPEFNQGIYNVWLFAITNPITLDDSICSLGEINYDYTPGTVEDVSLNFADGLFQIGFSGAVDLPYAVWASTDLVDWSQIGTAAQPSPGFFQFEDPATTNYSSRFYQVRLP
ncbi:MAG: hypothetical protein ACLQU4_15460 [Limisphaerales bacterium]